MMDEDYVNMASLRWVGGLTLPETFQQNWVTLRVFFVLE